ncbi:MAG: IPExxxVDY family protein [Bacteroidota bacterium]|jgi:hypothetical protein|nr:IPExxxVDY family protein [Bacteroidia bacterium]HPD54949.1 IPExxxVDY family protein [Bacteroidia bacterium]HRI40868.1 IPExxxVDY family protein [Bacteroidia bacterium]HRS40123.1 IPExxxVDY family protein [Bacteroidia bacterium]HRU62371.1 IPExxxVDY family protein [Bacteroidia bacterium]
MKKVVLRIDENEQYGFVLIGIVCQHRDYRLCREINLALDISLARDNDFEVFTKKRMEAMTFTRFSFTNEEEDEYYMLANKGDGGMLLPEQKQIDYFLLIRPGRNEIDSGNLLPELKKIPMILGAYAFEPKELKSRENLLF